MTAIAFSVSFACIALLAMSTIVRAWRTYRGRFAALREELRVTERGIAVRYSWCEATVARPEATVYDLRFTPTVKCLPFHPERELRVAA